jgi:hypothetical protein
MTKKHFIALADMIKAYNKPSWHGDVVSNFQGSHLEALAEFCASQNPHFNRGRWLAYIASKCGRNGGRK